MNEALKAIQSFCDQFGIVFKDKVTVIFNDIFILSPDMAKIVEANSFDVKYAGAYLGTIKKKTFIPSIIFLDKYLADAENQVTLDKKGAWLFLCGRDVFLNSIIEGESTSDSYVLIRDESNDILGYGKTEGIKSSFSSQVAIKNILDKGIVLRREMQN